MLHYIEAKKWVKTLIAIMKIKKTAFGNFPEAEIFEFILIIHLQLL